MSTNEESELKIVDTGNYKKLLEARVGIEPTHKGFADLSLTTWVPRLSMSTVSNSARKIQWQRSRDAGHSRTTFGLRFESGASPRFLRGSRTSFA